MNMKKLVSVVLLLLAITVSGSLIAQDDGDRLVGVWEPSHGKAKVKIEKNWNKILR